LIGLLKNIDLEASQRMLFRQDGTSTLEQNSSRLFEPNIFR